MTYYDTSQRFREWRNDVEEVGTSISMEATFMILIARPKQVLEALTELPTCQPRFPHILQRQWRKERDDIRNTVTLTHIYFYDEHSPRYYRPKSRKADDNDEFAKSHNFDDNQSPRDLLRKQLSSPRLAAAARASKRSHARALDLAQLGCVVESAPLADNDPAHRCVSPAAKFTVPR